MVERAQLTQSDTSGPRLTWRGQPWKRGCRFLGLELKSKASPGETSHERGDTNTWPVTPEYGWHLGVHPLKRKFIFPSWQHKACLG